jgi:putative transposase
VSDEKNVREPSQAARERAIFYAQTFLIPLLQAGHREMNGMVREFAQQTYEIPHSRRCKVSESAIWRLYAKYRKGGLEELCRKPRSDAGRHRVLPEHILRRAIEIHHDLPSRSVRRILKVLAKEFPLEIDQVKHSTLSHALAAAACPRVKPRAGDKFGPRKERHIRMRWDRPLQLVQSDVCGKTLWVTEQGKVCKASLIGVLDHCSKLCLHGEWFLAANNPALEKAVSTALLAYGVFDNLHVDHGKIYESYLLSNICSELGIALKYTRPGYAPGKGGIERYWLTVEEDFMREIGDSTRLSLQQLNAKYRAWEHEYHHHPHSATGEAPLERYQRLCGDPIFPDPVKLYRAGLLREKRIVDKRFCSVSVRCQNFAIHPSLRGKSVQVRYDPFALTEILVYDVKGSHFLQKAVPVAPDEKPAPFLPEEPRHRTPSIDALVILEAEHQEYLAAQTGTPGRPRRKAARFTTFCQLIARILKRESTMSDLNLETLRDHWDRYGPFESSQVCEVLEPLVARVGTALHLHEYLTALVDAKLNQKRGDKPQ